ncbi:hypothetical protein WEH80_26065 [Actinomycetes bacterium KLBMP 9759]
MRLRLSEGAVVHHVVVHLDDDVALHAAVALQPAVQWPAGEERAGPAPDRTVAARADSDDQVAGTVRR